MVTAKSVAQNVIFVGVFSMCASHSLCGVSNSFTCSVVVTPVQATDERIVAVFIEGDLQHFTAAARSTDCRAQRDVSSTKHCAASLIRSKNSFQFSH